MRHVYVAGPYTAATQDEIERNVVRAMDAGSRLLDAGLWPYIPHLSHYLEARRPRHYEEWMALDFAWVRRCDALLRLHGSSSGADREEALALSLGIPVFHSTDDVVRWAGERHGLEHVSAPVARVMAGLAKRVGEGA